MATAEGPAATSAVLYAAAKHIGAACSSPNAEFVACKQKDGNPAACLPQGDAVTGCVLTVCVGGEAPPPPRAPSAPAPPAPAPFPPPLPAPPR